MQRIQEFSMDFLLHACRSNVLLFIFIHSVLSIFVFNFYYLYAAFFPFFFLFTLVGLALITITKNCNEIPHPHVIWHSREIVPDVFFLLLLFNWVAK